MPAAFLSKNRHVDFCSALNNNLRMEKIYEDKDFVAINKPAGLESEKTADVLFLVHRLDKDTSGVLILAKNKHAEEFLREQFNERKVKKEYRALVLGEIKNKKGVIDLPIGRSGGKFFKRIAVGKLRGRIREAVTEYRVLEEFPDFEGVDGGLTLVAVFPLTGRTHQIRSHFSAIGHPVVCDKLYSGKRYICPFGLLRQFLHAFAIEFELPLDGKIRLEADMPEELTKVLAALRVSSQNDIF